MKENVVLIGFSGTGKTSVARILAEVLEWSLVDTDQEIESRCGMSIEQIFAQHGEAYFREQERLTVESLMQRRNVVVATGGGVVLSAENVANLGTLGLMVLLDASAETIFARLSKDSVDRPLLKKPERIRSLMDERAEYYKVANFVLGTDLLSEQDVAKRIVRFMRFQGMLGAEKNQLYGLIGEKLSHSLSPQIHSFFFQQLGIKAQYYLFPVSSGELAPAFEGLKILGAKGINVTIPYKSSIMALLDDIAPEAREIGAVNTVIFNEKRQSKGYNTDYKGFGSLIERSSIAVKGKTAVILGTGGGAKTVACYLRDHGAKAVHMVTRDSTLSSLHFPVISYAELAFLPGADLLINCTPIGMFPNFNEMPVEQAILSRFQTVVDLIYNPGETMLLSEAKMLGLQTCNGLSMLAYQAAFAQELWQGRTLSMADVEPLYQMLVTNQSLADAGIIKSHLM